MRGHRGQTPHSPKRKGWGKYSGFLPLSYDSPLEVRMPAMDVIDYKIYGDDMQYVEVELDQGEAALGEAGAMMYMEDGIGMETIFGDGSTAQRGFMDALMGAGKRLLMGESLFMTVFMNQSSGKRKIAFGAPYPGKIIPVQLSQ